MLHLSLAYICGRLTIPFLYCGRILQEMLRGVLVSGKDVDAVESGAQEGALEL